MDGTHRPIQGLTSSRVRLGGVSDGAVFSSIHHPYGRHPLTLLACTLQPLNSCSGDSWCHLMILVEFKKFGYIISSFEVERIGGA